VTWRSAAIVNNPNSLSSCSAAVKFNRAAAVPNPHQKGVVNHSVFLTGRGGLPDGLDGLLWSSPVHSFWWTAMTQSRVFIGLDGLVQISMDWIGLQSRIT
jgi:hypothetical protein